MRRNELHNPLKNCSFLHLRFTCNVLTEPRKCSNAAMRLPLKFRRFLLSRLLGLLQPQPFLSILHYCRGHHGIVHTLRNDSIDHLAEHVNVEGTNVVEPPTARGVPATRRFGIRPPKTVWISTRLPRNGLTTPTHNLKLLCPWLKVRARAQHVN